MLETKTEKPPHRGDGGLPLVAIVGRPNVGKSTLFNRIVGERRSIVGDEPGITRDRIYSEAEWSGHRFSIIDTGGMAPEDEEEIPANIMRQAAAAINEAGTLIWVVDAREGITPQDEELARLLRSTGKRVLVAPNKAEAARIEFEAGEFYRFGFDEVFPLSAEQGNGIGEILDAAIRGFRVSEKDEAGKDLPREIRLAIVGRPNVGKSSLLNKLSGEERVIVSPIAGTTRDSVDTVLEREGRCFRVIDTAGIRRKGKAAEMPERLSILMARRSLQRADVAILVVDGEEGVAGLDATIGGYAHEAGCSILIAVNKWDAIKNKETGTMSAFERELRDHMKFLDWAPVLMISALSGQRVDRILPLILRANEARNRRVPTSQLNAFFDRAIAQPRGGAAPAPAKGGVSRLHVQYITQASVRPPTFVLFTAGGRGGLHFSYVRYLQNRLREEFDFFATPLKIVERHRKGRKSKT